MPSAAGFIVGMKHHCYAAIGILFFLAPLGVHAQAVISEVLWMGSDQSTSDEWLEIARLPCVSVAECPPVDLSDWSIVSLNSSGLEVTIATFPVGTMLTIEQPLVVARTAASTSRLEQEPSLVASTLSLPNTKLLLKLVNAAGTVVDEVDDGVGAPFAGANPSGGTKASMERIDLSVPGTVRENWRTATEAMTWMLVRPCSARRAGSRTRICRRLRRRRVAADLPFYPMTTQGFHRVPAARRRTLRPVRHPSRRLSTSS